jgi:hypothetical protein
MHDRHAATPLALTWTAKTPVTSRGTANLVPDADQVVSQESSEHGTARYSRAARA